MCPEANRAYNSWRDQRHRCRNPNVKSYKWYGAKGIKVLYSSRAFVGWWLIEQKRLGLKTPTVSRVNHDDDYRFGNIRLEERFDNIVKDVQKRHPGKFAGTILSRAVVVYRFGTKNIIKLCRDATHAGDITGIKRSNVAIYLSGKKRRLKNKDYDFRYLDDLMGE